MIIQCKECKKSFVVPDNAITSNGRLVQCGSCGYKWTQYPKKDKPKSKSNFKTPKIPKKVISTEKEVFKSKKTKKKKKKTKGIDVYSEEYLQKKHGIKIIDPSSLENKQNFNKKNIKSKNIVSSMGFYSYVIIFLILIVSMLGVLNLTDELIISNFPVSEPYILYLFETLNNFKIIIFDFLDL